MSMLCCVQPLPPRLFLDFIQINHSLLRPPEIADWVNSVEEFDEGDRTMLLDYFCNKKNIGAKTLGTLIEVLFDNDCEHLNSVAEKLAAAPRRALRSELDKLRLTTQDLRSIIPEAGPDAFVKSSPTVDSPSHANNAKYVFLLLVSFNELLDFSCPFSSSFFSHNSF
jgi:hypothetical protein